MVDQVRVHRCIGMASLHPSQKLRLIAAGNPVGFPCFLEWLTVGLKSAANIAMKPLGRKSVAAAVEPAKLTWKP
jgi:hypothetical protein